MSEQDDNSIPPLPAVPSPETAASQADSASIPVATDSSVVVLAERAERLRERGGDACRGRRLA